MRSYVAGFTDGTLESSVGKFDGVLVKYAPSGARQWTRQFGTTEDDGADERVHDEADAAVRRKHEVSHLHVVRPGERMMVEARERVFGTAFADAESDSAL